MGYAAMHEPGLVRVATRTAREAEERVVRKAEHQAQQRLAAQRSDDWQAWFRTSFHAELMRAEPLYDALGEIVAQLRNEIAALQKRVDALENQLSVDSRFSALERSLAARAEARDTSRRGPRGEKGERGACGERGALGPRGTGRSSRPHGGAGHRVESRSRTL